MTLWIGLYLTGVIALAKLLKFRLSQPAPTPVPVPVTVPAARPVRAGR